LVTYLFMCVGITAKLFYRIEKIVLNTQLAILFVD
jgi:hypothetical protein